jgi:predicted ArsR family transcriptional regulator
MEKISARQHEILEHLLNNKIGLSIDELATKLDVSRTAIKQHFAALEKDGYVKKNTLNKTAGRPVVIYGITDKGINHFPKQYAWFNELVLNEMLEELGAEQLQIFMARLGQSLAGKLVSQFDGKSFDVRLKQLTDVMNDLGYHATVPDEVEQNTATLVATNCVYHDIALQHPQICEFDLALMSVLLDKKVEQKSCMVKGDCSCRFSVKNS